MRDRRVIDGPGQLRERQLERVVAPHDAHGARALLHRPSIRQRAPEAPSRRAQRLRQRRLRRDRAERGIGAVVAAVMPWHTPY